MAQVIAHARPGHLLPRPRTKRVRECRVGQSRDLLRKDNAALLQMHAKFGEPNAVATRLLTRTICLAFVTIPSALLAQTSQCKRMAIDVQDA